MVVLAEREGGLLEPLENMWGFGSPLIGPGAGSLLSDWLLARPRPVLLLGLPLAEEFLASILLPLSGRFDFQLVPPTTRFVASLESGVEAWLAERRPGFRRNLRAARRRVAGASLDFRWIEAFSPDALPGIYEKVLAVEARSRKSARGGGVESGPMRDFYADLWPRLARQGQLRVLLAESQGTPVGYLHGAALGRHFRGLQFSFDESFADLGLGNVLQYEAMDRLFGGGVRRYDLGAHSEYKERWGDPGLRTVGLLLRPLGETGSGIGDGAEPGA